MFDVNKVRKDFPMLSGKTMQGKPLIYLDFFINYANIIYKEILWK